jgi:predicted dehydrogenase
MSNTITRRQALMGMAAVAAPFGLPHLLQDKKPVGWAVLGLGSYAEWEIMPSFKACSDSKLVALISGHPEKLSRFGERYGISEKNRYTYDQMDAIKDNPEIDVVYVITPPATHPEFTIRAAKAGKHVHSEKPMAPTAEDCQKMIDACRRAGKLLQIGYRCHFESHNLRAIKAFRSGELGKVTSLSSDHGFSIGRGLWRTQKSLAGGGSMMDIGIYSLQALRYLSGEEPTHVEATITNPPNDDRFAEVEDTVDFKLHFPSGLIGHGTSGYSWNPGKNRYQIVGEKGTLLADPATPYGGHRLSVNGQPLEVENNNQFATMMDSFSRCVRDGGKVQAPGEEGKRDIHIIQCVYQAAATGKMVKV